MSLVSDEFRLKRAWNYSLPRVPAELLPVVYGTMSGGSGGLWACPCISTGGYVYAVAGHPVLSPAQGNTVTVYNKDGAVISAGDYTFAASNEYEGQEAIATLTFTSDQSANEPISIRCQGKSSAGVMIENPVDIVEDFLINLAGFTAEDLDQTWLERARSVTRASGLKLSGLIDQNQTVGAVLSGMLFPWGDWWRDKNGCIRLRAEAGPGSYPESEVAGYFPARVTEQARIEAATGALVNQAEAEYGYNFLKNCFEAGDDGASSADLLSQSVYGIQKGRFQLKWVRETGVAQKIQANLISRFKTPALIVTLRDQDCKNIRLERGDLAAVSLSWFYDQDRLPLANQLMKVLEVETDFINRKMSFRLQGLGRGLFLTKAYPADGSRPAGGSTRAGGDRDRTEYY
ncbi:MAG: hypothetical protein SV487_06440 [Thermodesulfobacteriota bacterium]|nr:hypothetical protein [Thermodesulfobacteriota bacterium]